MLAYHVQHNLHVTTAQTFAWLMYIAGGSEMLMGLCITVTCVVELPIFAANNWILKKLGVNSVIHITLAVCVIRMVNFELGGCFGHARVMI